MTRAQAERILAVIAKATEAVEQAMFYDAPPTMTEAEAEDRVRSHVIEKTYGD